MKGFFQKAALLLSACALMLNTAVQSDVYAAQKEKIVLSASSSSVKPGESFTLTVGTDAGSAGIAGLDIIVHYDSSKVTLDVGGKFEYSSSFIMENNYSYSSGEVLILGASAKNVKKGQTLVDLQFKMKSGVSGNVDFWVEVRKMVYYDSDGDYVNCTYNVPTKNSPVRVSAKTETTTKAKTTTKKKTTTTTTKKPATETKKPDQTKEKTTTTPNGTTKPQKTADPVVITNGDDLFSYTNEGDFDESNAETYSFVLGDYADDLTKGYDISIAVKASDEVVGAIGYNDVNGEWTTESQHSDAGQSEWVAKDVQVRSSDDIIYVQLYFMAPDSSFQITKITILPHGTVAATESKQTTTTANSGTATGSGTTVTTAPSQTTSDLFGNNSTQDSTGSTNAAAAVTDSNKPKRDSGYMVFVFVLAFLEILGTAVLITYKRVKFRQDAYTETY